MTSILTSQTLMSPTISSPIFIQRNTSQLDKIPGKISFVPTDAPQIFSYEFMKDFIRQNPFFFIKEIEITYSYRENHNERTVGNCIFTNSKYDHQQQIHMIESFIIQNSNDLFHGNQKHIRLLKKLVDFYLGVYEPNEFLLKDILELLYTQFVVEDVPEDGDCYFHSIGLNIDKSAQEVRNIIADHINPDLDIPIFMSGYPNDKQLKMLYLKDKEEFKNIFSDVIRKCCNFQGRDGDDCFWGGDDLDPILAKIFSTSIHSFSYLIFLEQSDPSRHPIASQIPIFMWNMVWKDFFNKLFLVINKDFKKFQYKLVINKIFEDKPQEMSQQENWIGYLHIGDHFYSVCENKK
jgi:hypothetical protein